MAHVLDLPTSQRDLLYAMNAPQLRQRVLLTAAFLEVIGSNFDGSPIFGNTYNTFTVDISDRVEGRISIGNERPIWPDDSDNPITAGEVSVTLINTDTYIATTQTGAMIRLADIDQGTIQIDLMVGDVTQPIRKFTGRIIGPPKEEAGRTTFMARDTLWDTIRKPVLYESLPESRGSAQTVLAFNGRLRVGKVAVNTTHGHYCNRNGILGYDAQGSFVTRSSNSKPDGVFLTSVILGNRAKLGKYTIDFTDNSNYILTYPDNTAFIGNVFTTLTTPFVILTTAFWNFIAGGDEVKIEFFVSFVADGNPVTIARNLIEKALLDNWGQFPAQTLNVNMDINEWDAAERRFKSFMVYFNTTNEDNSVWQEKSGNKPVNCLTVAQQLLDHVGCFIRLKPDGKVGILTPYIDDTVVHELSTFEATSRIVIDPSEQINVLRVQYGGASDGKSMIASTEKDIRLTTASERISKTVNAPFFKAGRSLRRAEWLRDTYARRYLKRQVLISTTVSPQMGAGLLPSDRVLLTSRVQPKLSLICEVIKIDSEVGRDVGLTLIPIQSPEGVPFRVCLARLGVEGLW